jgi:hypothetical protein
MRQVIMMIMTTMVLALASTAEDAFSVIEGRVRPAGPSIYMEGSHELVDAEDKLLARLSGMRYEVDLSPYDGQYVKLTGEWRPTVEEGGKIFEVRSVERCHTNSP